MGCRAASAEYVVVAAHASRREKKQLQLARLRAAEAKRVLRLAGAREENVYIEERWHSRKENKLVDGWNQRVDIHVVGTENSPISCEWKIPEGKLPPRA